MPVETCTTPTDKIPREKPLQEHSRSCRASGARPAGPLTRPRGKAFATGREERTISRLQHLREPDRYTRRCSGATVGDSHEGPLKNRGESCLKPAKNTKRKTNLGPNAKHTHNTIHAVVAPAAHRSGPAKRPPRARSASLEGSNPPRMRSTSLEGSHRLRAGSASLEGLRFPRAGSASLEVPSRAYLLPHTCTGI
jgi:hypothetical protein